MTTPHSQPLASNGYWHSAPDPGAKSGGGRDTRDYISIGSVRVRLIPSPRPSSNSNRNKVAQSGGDESDCCCGVPWPRTSRILLQNAANYSNTAATGAGTSERRSAPVYRSTLQWTQSASSVSNNVTGCFGKDNNGVNKFQPRNSRHPLPARSSSSSSSHTLDQKSPSRGLKSQGTRYGVDSESSSENIIIGAGDCESQRLLPGVDSRASGVGGDRVSRICTLDRLPKFRFGGGSSGSGSSSERGGGRGGKKGANAHKKKPQRSSDKADRLRELTEKLKLPSNKQIASTESSSGKKPESIVTNSKISTASANVITSVRTSEDRSAGVSGSVSASVSAGGAGGAPVQDVFECVRIPKSESLSLSSSPRPVMGSTSYTQRTIPFRSASFSQMNCNQINGKTARASTENALEESRPPISETMDLDLRTRPPDSLTWSSQPSTSESVPQSPQTPSKLSLIPQATARLLRKGFGSQSFDSSSLDEPESLKAELEVISTQYRSKELPPQPPKRTKHRVPKVDHFTQTPNNEKLEASKSKSIDSAPKSKLRSPAQLSKQLSLNSNLETLDTFLNELIGIKMEYEDKYGNRSLDKSHKKARSINNISMIMDSKLSKNLKSDTGDSNNNLNCGKCDITYSNTDNCSAMRSSGNENNTSFNSNNGNISNSSNNNNDIINNTNSSTGNFKNYVNSISANSFEDNNKNELGFCGNDAAYTFREMAIIASKSNERGNSICDMHSGRSGEISQYHSMEEETDPLPVGQYSTPESTVSDPGLLEESFVSTWSSDKKFEPPIKKDGSLEQHLAADSPKTNKDPVCNDCTDHDKGDFNGCSTVQKETECLNCIDDRANHNLENREQLKSEKIPNLVKVYVTNDQDENSSVNLTDPIEESGGKLKSKGSHYKSTVDGSSLDSGISNDPSFDGALSESSPSQFLLTNGPSVGIRESLKLSKDSSLESNSNLSEVHFPRLEPETKDEVHSSSCELKNLLNLDANPAAKEELISRLQSLQQSGGIDSCGNDKRRPKLIAQGSEERDDEGILLRSPKRFVLTRADSLSEGESELGEKRPPTPASDRDSTASPSILSGCDLSDNELTQKKQLYHHSHHHFHPHHHHHHHPPKMYEKRPLRGPYGQMLEAEMKKPEGSGEKLTKLHSSEDLKFLIKECLKFPPSGIAGNSKLRAVDDCHLRRSHTSPGDQQPYRAIERISPKRKVSANIPYSHPVSLAPPSLESGHLVHHQRTTSSPSQLEGCSSAVNSSSPSSSAPPQPSQQLLAQLLKGSSERVCNRSEPSPILQTGTTTIQKDTRTHVVEELYETEKSYVDSLRTLINKYLKPLKDPDNSTKLDAGLVDEIFCQVPEILAHHLEFLEALDDRLKNWNMKQKIIIGDILLETFSKQSVIESYTIFIKNWKSAREMIKSTCQSEPSFARFLETMAREHKGKLALDSLFIMPVQRIPRYELLIQTLLKHTEESHPDFSTLIEAQRAVHALAVHINCMERDSLELEQIERLIEGLGHLVAADRTFLRHDLVTMAVSAQSVGRKERALFLFSDLLVITSIKRKSGTARKITSTSPESVTSSFEANKYKLLTKIPLENIEVVKIKDKSLRRMLWEIENLTKDITTLSQMANLVSTLHCPHIQLESSIRDMLSVLSKQLSERQASDSQLSFLELILHTRNGSENISIAFSKPEERASWEGTFNEAKQRITLSSEKKSCPEFVIPLQIRKTRAGLQFTCAAPSACQKDVWVCNSDGYIGQVCKLSLYPKPAVSQCIPVYSARILCIASVPTNNKIRDEDHGSRTSTSASMSVEDIDQGGNIHLDSSSSEDEEDRDKDKEEEKMMSEKRQTPQNTPSTDQDDDVESTMWLGTEDGCILIYKSLDGNQNRENCVEIKHGSAVYSIVFFHEKVFVSFANGNICVYSRDQNNTWNTSEPTSVISIGSAVAPVTRMCPVLDKLWCSSHSNIHILDPSLLKVVHKFNVSGDINRAVTCFVVAGLGVWLSLHNSAIMRLIHATTYETLAEVNIAPAVTKMLDSCDDIIRQHKAACLRVTSLLAHKELLWIGTSAGVLLTMPLPVITPTTSRLNSVPVASGAPYGHTGHVRFLTMVEKTAKDNNEHTKIDQNSEQLLVISGGDGYEDFRSTNVAEIAGREDSTNHLLLWRM